MQGCTSTPRTWLRLGICLVASAVLHAALSAVDWSKPPTVPAGNRSLAVALIEAPEVLVTSAPKSAPRIKEQVRPPAPAKPVSLPSAPPQVATVPSSPQADIAVVTEPPTTDAAAAAALQPAVGAEAGGGKVGQAAMSGDGTDAVAAAGGGLIRATPRYESNPLPDYPRLARQNRWEGTVRLRARVSPAGEIESVTLERSSGHVILDHAALDGVRGWRFIPASRAGVPVVCEVSIPVAFRLTE